MKKFIADAELDLIVGGFQGTDDLWLKTDKSNGSSGFIAWDIWPSFKSR
ncbi:MAG: hypothetical protein KDJ47_13945 [Hyphomicrobiaceae bacterium]|nr:hypothetical protein [Hyphomicrobiaceae bacterium]